MDGAKPPLPQYAFMVWCSVEIKAQGQLYLLPVFNDDDDDDDDDNNNNNPSLLSNGYQGLFPWG
jgi:hypothetical protein